MALLGSGLLVSLYALTEITGFGFSLEYTATSIAGALIIVGFVFWERRASEPLIQASILRERVLVSSMLAAVFQSLVFRNVIS